MTTLTTLEAAALRVCLNYDTRAEQLGDNFSNGGPTEFQTALALSVHQADGVIGSLSAKGLGYLDDRSSDLLEAEDYVGRPYASAVKRELWIFWMTADGVNAIFDHIDADG